MGRGGRRSYRAKVRVALVVDNPFRDLPGLVLVSAALARRGAQSFLVPMMRQDVELRALAPDAAVLNYLRPTNEALARDCVVAGIHVSVLETEGGQLGDVSLFDQTLSRDRSLHAALSSYFAWGAGLAEHCVTAGWYRPSQLVVSGQPRFDFYSTRWREAGLAASPYAEHVPRPMVLVLGNFPLANPGFQTPAQEARMMVEVFGADPDEISAWQVRQARMLDEFVDLVHGLASRLPEATFVYRPHPFERADTYEGLLKAGPNLRLEKVGGVEGWILRASAVVQCSSTTAIEAGMARVPALTPAWLESPDPTASVDEATIRCRDVDEMVELLRCAVAGDLELPTTQRRVLDDTLMAWFGATDGGAHERVADALVRVDATSDAAALAAACRAIGLGRRMGGTDLWRRARQAVKRFAPPEVIRAARGGPTTAHEKNFCAVDVERLVDALGRSEPAYGPAAVSVRRADRTRDYRNAIGFGRSVAVSPKP